MLQRSKTTRAAGSGKRSGAMAAPVTEQEPATDLERDENMADIKTAEIKTDVKKIAAEGAAQAQKIVTQRKRCESE